MSKQLAIVLSSGGLHSAVTLGLASREYRLAMLHLQDGRATAIQAAAAFDKQVEHFKPIKSWSTDATHLRRMALPAESAGLIQVTGSDPHANLVPFREMQMLTIAAGYARQMRASVLMWGVQFDTRQNGPLAKQLEFTQLLNGLLDFLSPDMPLTVKTPLLGLTDRQVIELGYQMAIPFSATWTCQMPIANPCMSCPACARRTRSFRAAQLLDPLIHKPKRSAVDGPAPNPTLARAAG